MTCPNCNMPVRTCQSHHFFQEDKLKIVTQFKSRLMPVINENEPTSASHSRANVGISQLSIPLAWNNEQHFKRGGETRTYSMFAVLQTKTKVVDSRMVTNIDRYMTDVNFPESFVFEEEPEDFCVEISLYAARTDQGITDNSGSLKSKLSRSLGKKFGGSVKSQLSAFDSNFGQRGDSILGGTHFNLLARSYLVLTDASDNCNIHDLKLSAFADLSGPPLYGHLMCRLMVQPHSTLFPIAEGPLTVKPLGEPKAINNVRCRLQGGNFQCYMNSNIHHCPTAEETLLLVPLTSGSRIISTSQPHTFLLSTESTDDADGSEIFITAESHKMKEAWKAAIEKQINDCVIWGPFAFTSSRLTFEKKSDPVKETLSKAAGNRLYDKISIVGTVSKSNMAALSPSLSYCPRELSPLRNEASKTAPSRRPKQRTNVMDIFPTTSPTYEQSENKVDDSRKVQKSESYTSYTPLSNKMSDNYEYSTLSRYNDVNIKMMDQYGKTPTGKKSWSRSLGAFIGKKINVPSIQVTRL